MRGLKRSLLAAALAGGVVIALGGPALAQAGTTPEDLQAAAQEFEAELRAAGLTGPPGDLDLPPGELTLTGVLVISTDPAVIAATGGGGSSLSGPCMGVAISLDADGEVIDFAADFDPAGAPVDMLDSDFDAGKIKQAFTSSNPFEVDVDGQVVYAGVAGPPAGGPRNHTWFIDTLGLSLDSGGDDNPEGKNRNAGSVNLGEDLPAAAKISALFRIKGEMSADGGFFCSGHGFFKTVGGIPVLGGAGLVLVLASGLGALFNVRPARTWSG